MGVSSDGLLIFGFPLGEEGENPMPTIFNEEECDGDYDFSDFILKEAGIPEWEENGPDDYWQKIRDAEAECPVSLELYCSYDYPMYFLAVGGHKLSVLRGYTKEVTEAILSVPNEEIEKAKAWCENHKVEWQEPKWFLASMYG